MTRNISSYTLQGGPRVPGNGSPLDNLFNQNVRGKQTTGYVQDEWLIKPKLFVSAGVRTTQFDRSSQTFVDPRVAVSLPMTGNLTFKAAIGRYHQVTSQSTREDLLQGNRQFWSVADNVLVPVTSARDVIGGATFQRAASSSISRRSRRTPRD